MPGTASAGRPPSAPPSSPAAAPPGPRAAAPAARARASAARSGVAPATAPTPVHLSLCRPCHRENGRRGNQLQYSTQNDNIINIEAKIVLGWRPQLCLAGGWRLNFSKFSGVLPCFSAFCAWYPLDWTDSNLKDDNREGTISYLRRRCAPWSGRALALAGTARRRRPAPATRAWAGCSRPSPARARARPSAPRCTLRKSENAPLETLDRHAEKCLGALTPSTPSVLLLLQWTCCLERDWKDRVGRQRDTEDFRNYSR